VAYGIRLHWAAAGTPKVNVIEGSADGHAGSGVTACRKNKTKGKITHQTKYCTIADDDFSVREPLWDGAKLVYIFNCIAVGMIYHL
jgi:hypothetical protein